MLTCGEIRPRRAGWCAISAIVAAVVAAHSVMSSSGLPRCKNFESVVDGLGAKHIRHRKLRPVVTGKSGRMYGSSSHLNPIAQGSTCTADGVLVFVCRLARS